MTPRQILPFVGSFLLIAVLATPSFGQTTRPWDGSGPPRYVAPTSPGSMIAPPMPSESGYSRGISYGADGFPSAEVMEAARLQGMLGEARARFSQAQSERNSFVDRQWDEYEHSPAVQAAKAEQDRYFHDMEKVRKQALKELGKNRDYQELLLLKQETAAKIADLREQDHPDKDQIKTLSLVKMGYAKRLSAMEADAINNVKLDRARVKLMEATDKLKDMREKFQRSLRNNPEFVTVQRNMEEARVAQDSISAHMEAAILARRYALNYSWQYLYNTSPYYMHSNYYGVGGYYGY